MIVFSLASWRLSFRRNRNRVAAVKLTGYLPLCLPLAAVGIGTRGSGQRRAAGRSADARLTLLMMVVVMFDGLLLTMLMMMVVGNCDDGR